MYKITSRFNDFEKFRNTQHKGYDFAMPEGEPLRAIVEGKVRIVDFGNKLSGKTVYIDTIDGKTIVYGHLSEFSVNSGDIVHSGDLLGLAGNTGFSTGSHLHFAVKENGMWLDPMPYIDKIQNMNLLQPLEKIDTIGINTADFIQNFSIAPTDFLADFFSSFKLNFIHMFDSISCILTDHIFIIEIIQNLTKFFFL